jgi:S-adenosylmethionine:tRNA ribosyltransferase-isomerase
MVEIVFDLAGPALDTAIAAHGEMPLPPYIAGKRPADARDSADYQTVYAREAGSVAAPTAGLHFTRAMLQSLAGQGVEQAHVTLHVGLGTFLPVKADDTREHRMHAEWADLDAATATCLNGAHAAGGRIAAVGTTALRTLESAAAEDDTVRPFTGDTDIFITPGYRFRAADLLVTNFHLPRSTLFMLVSAFMGLDVMRAAYAEAIRARYRFYSYGDACLLLRRP